MVDAAQGIEAQTLANVYLALDNDLEILPVINKIDLPAADPERVRTEVEDVIGLDASEAVLASAKAGIGIEEILEQIKGTHCYYDRPSSFHRSGSRQNHRPE